MSVCEKCKTKFEPKAHALVTTTRVLCEACAAERAAEKMRARSQAAAVGSAPASSSSSSVAQARSAAPASVRSQPAPTATKPLARVAARTAADEDEERKNAVRLITSAKEREKRTMLIGSIVAGVAVVIAGVVIFMIVSKNKAEDAQRARIAAEQSRVFNEAQKLFVEGTETASQALIAYAEANETIWSRSDQAAEIQTMVAKAKNRLEKEQQRRDTEKSLTGLEADLNGIENRTPEEIAHKRRLLADIEPRGEGLGAEFVARMGKAHTELDRGYAISLHSFAKTFRDANPDKGRLALQHFTRAEDEIQKLFEEAIKAKNQDMEPIFRDHYRELITESDELVLATFPEEAIEKLPWMDLLTGEHSGPWNAAEVSGFAHHLENGTMTMIGPDATATGEGLISIGDKEKWRDFVVDMEFTLDTGSFDLLFRLGNKADRSVPHITLAAGPEGLVAGKTYTLTARMIGSTLSSTYYPDDLTVEPDNLAWIDARKGALGFQLKEGTRLKITRLKVRELRSSSKT